jgi:hypothetical protein
MVYTLAVAVACIAFFTNAPVGCHCSQIFSSFASFWTDPVAAVRPVEVVAVPQGTSQTCCLARHHHLG